MAAPANYSLWLEPPPGPLRDALAREIGTQAAAAGSPGFEPHVTLVPDVQLPEEQVLATMAELAKGLQPLRVSFLDVACGASYHQCVYILAAQDAPLLAASAAARAALGAPPPARPYMPHLSLLYADLDEGARRAAAAAAVQRLYGEGSGAATLLPEAGFTAGALSVWLTPVEDRGLASWRRVAEFPLGG